MARLLHAEWPNLDRTRLYALLTRFAQGSATLAASDYAARRLDSGIRSQFTVPHAPAPTVEHFDKTLNWVFDGVDQSSPEALQRLEAAFTRLALQSGRSTIVTAVHDDKQARGWARETRTNCCYFCAALATRGAVYKDEGAAGRTANEKFTGSGDFKFHDNCRCIAVPVFGVYEKTAEARAWTRQWHDLRREHGGVSLQLWRQAFEGRLDTNVPPQAG
jgi:hypothetical protein